MQIGAFGRLSAGLLMACLAGCASVPTLPAAETLFKDSLFQPLPQGIDADAIFAMTPAMQRYAETELKPLMRYDGPERALIDALYDQGRLQLQYDSTSTLDAAGAFAARAGNCLSLVIMTGAFAEHFGLNLQYQEVFAKITWSRSGNLAMANRHVNLKFTPQSGQPSVSLEQGGSTSRSDGLTVDFLPSQQAVRYRSRVISRDTVIAMFMNNRAAELLAEGKPDAAYWWAREAIRRLPAFMDSYNTLGVVYQQHGNLSEAEQTLRQALLLEPENSIAMSNLVSVLAATGKQEESKQLAARLAEIEPFPPFHYYDLGLAALKAQDFALARQLFQRELNRAADDADSHFGLAIANLYLGDLRKARKQLAKAIDSSTSSESRKLYSAKLDWLKAQGYVAPRSRESPPARGS